MTDLSQLHADATTIANRVTDLAGLADELTDAASAAVTDARRAMERLLDVDAEADREALLTALETAREALKDIHGKASTILHGLDTLDTEGLMCSLDDAQHEQRQQQDLAAMALDVARGIRDPDELSRLVHDCAGLAL